MVEDREQNSEQNSALGCFCRSREFTLNLLNGKIFKRHSGTDMGYSLGVAGLPPRLRISNTKESKFQKLLMRIAF